LIPSFKVQIQGFIEERKHYVTKNVDFDVVKPILGKLFDIHPVMALEMRFVLALVRTELHGVMVNESAIRDIVKTHLEEIAEAEQKLGFNPASNPSCLEFVKRKIGPQMTSASKEALAEYYHIPEIELLGRAKQAKARAGLLVKMYDKKADGRIHTEFTQILSTSRMASKNPNMQQIPRTVKGFIYKAPPGRCVFSADYPAVELRLAAAWHEEPVMVNAFRHGEDLHYKMAQIMLPDKKIPITEEEKHDESGLYINKEERTAAKNANFGYIFGGSWYSYQKVQLVKNHLKIPDADAQKARKDFMSLYKTIAKHIEQTKFRFEHGKPRQVQMKDSMGNTYTQTLPYQEEIINLFGRRIAVETANTALNYPIQSSGGECAKIAICLFDYICETENIDAFVCNIIHDDIVVETSISDKPRAQKALADAMNGAANCLMGHYFLTDVSDEIETFAETPLETA
jgi:DNA polymerase-1